MIKKIILSASLAFFTPALYAGSIYADLGMSVMDTDYMNNTGFGPMGRLGYLFGDKANSFGIEAEANPLMVDMDGGDNNNDGNHNGSGYGPSDRDIAFTIGTYLVYSYNIPNTKFYLRPRAGVVWPNLGDNIYKDSSSFGYGLSVLYNFKNNFSGYVSYGSFGSGVNGGSVGISVDF